MTSPPLPRPFRRVNTHWKFSKMDPGDMLFVPAEYAKNAKAALRACKQRTGKRFMIRLDADGCLTVACSA